jgi:hypothetical protein
MTHLVLPPHLSSQQEILESADMAHGGQKMAEELAAYRTEDPARRSLQDPSANTATDHADVNQRLDAIKSQISAVIGDVPVKADRSPPKSAKEASGVDERFDRIRRKIAARPANPPFTDRPLSASTGTRKRPHPGRGDAFDPSLHPNAPGAPRPLGTTAPSRPLTD